MRILVTAGPTREYLDPVRYLSNASSGKMGYAVASAGLCRGHDVVLISGPVEIPPPDGIELVQVISSQEMFEAAVSHFDSCQAAVMAAAVSDYRPQQRSDKKLAKKDGLFTLELEPTLDICAHLGASKGDRVVVGFALEDHDGRAHALSKLQRKRCDAIVLNGVSTLSADSAEIEILQAEKGWFGPFSGSKTRMAERIIELVEDLCGPGPSV